VDTIFIELVSSGIEENQPSEVVLCKTIDISRTGLLVWVNRELTVGAILQIGVELSSGGSTLYLTGEVRRCQHDHTNAERWEVGFELLNASDSDIDTWQELVTQLSQQSA
jgi:hypothetical protein